MKSSQLLVGVVCVLACKGRDAAREAEPEAVCNAISPTGAKAPEPAPAAGMVDRKVALDEAEEKATEDRPADGTAIAQSGAAGGDQSKEATRPRAWFPETFLFEPLVVTDDNGNATTVVKVPDRLTTWRVLALAHSRSGSQGGATTSFLGTLPAYVDIVVPPFLTVGDEVRLPIQIVNTTSAPITSDLVLEATHARLSSAGGKRTVPAEGSIVEYVTLKAERAGTIALKAGLAGTDAVVRTIAVQPAGRPLVTTRAGTLAAPRTLTIEGPAASEPATDRVRLLVFPGALALLRTELSASTARAGVAEDAYALLLAGRAPALLAALGDTADPVALRSLAIVAGQRAIRHARTLDVTSATILAEAALAHPTSPVLARLGERAAAYLAQNQRPDGTFSGATGWTLQRVLMATADATRAVAASAENRHRTQAVHAKAAGAFARSAATVVDGYTAAAMLASGAIDPGPLADTLRERVKAGIVAGTDGAKLLAIEPGVVRADGASPTAAEATALAVLALKGDASAPLADLGATLLGSYSPVYGWGDGRANLLCMQAVLALFAAPVPADVKITLTMDGKPIAEGQLDRAKLREVLALEAPAPGLAGAHTWAITAEPPVAGLGYSLALHSYVPWTKGTVQQGLELALPPVTTAAVGKPVELALTAIAPSGVPLHVQHALPAGVTVDTPSLEALVTAGTITRFTAADGKVDLYAPPLAPGQTFSAKYEVVPTLAGTLKSAASRIEAGGAAFHVPPTDWIVR